MRSAVVLLALSLLEMEAETWGPLFLTGLIVVVVLFFMSGKRYDNKHGIGD